MRGQLFHAECMPEKQMHSSGMQVNGNGALHYSVGGLVLDVHARLASLDGRAVDLTRTEFDLLVLLATRDGGVVSAADIVRHLWGAGRHKAEQVVQVHVCNIRRKLCDNARTPLLLHTIRGYGYALRDGRGGERPGLKEQVNVHSQANVWITVTGKGSFFLRP